MASLNKPSLLVLGGTGFIGYHLCKSLLDDNYEVLGLDNLNEYYFHNLPLKAKLIIRNIKKNSQAGHGLLHITL